MSSSRTITSVTRYDGGRYGRKWLIGYRGHDGLEHHITCTTATMMHGRRFAARVWREHHQWVDAWGGRAWAEREIAPHFQSTERAA